MAEFRKDMAKADRAADGFVVKSAGGKGAMVPDGDEVIMLREPGGKVRETRKRLFTIFAERLGLPVTATGEEICARVNDLANDNEDLRRRLVERGDVGVMTATEREIYEMRERVGAIKGFGEQGGRVVVAKRADVPNDKTIGEYLIEEHRRHCAEARLGGRVPLQFSGFLVEHKVLNPALHEAHERERTPGTDEQKRAARIMHERATGDLRKPEVKSEPAGAYGRIVKLAEALREKEPELSVATAQARVLSENPELSKQYRRDVLRIGAPTNDGGDR